MEPIQASAENSLHSSNTSANVSTASVTPPGTKSLTFRRLIFWIHLGMGCVAGVVILFLAITGTILAYQKQVITFAERGYRSTPSSPGAPGLPVNALLSLASEAKGKAPDGIVLHADSNAPVELIFGKTDRVLLDRYTGRILGAGATRTRAFFAAVNGLHRWFGVPPDKKQLAQAVQGGMDLALLALVVTGVFLWWPRNWNWQRLKAAFFLRARLKGRAFDWNLHNVLGFWTSVPLAIIVITGAILSYSWATNLLYRVAGDPVEHSVSDGGGKSGKQKSHEKKSHAAKDPDEDSGKQSVELESILTGAQTLAPGWRTLSTTLPRPGDRQVKVTAVFDDGSRPDLRSELDFDRTTGDLVQRKTFSSNTLGRRLRLFVRGIHTGEAAGTLGQTVIALAALGCCILIWTGLQLFARRIQLL